MTPETRQKYLMWLYQNPGQHRVEQPAKMLGLSKIQSARIAKYLISENLAEGQTWEMIDGSWDGFLEIAPRGMKMIENDIPHNEIIRPVNNNTVVHGNNSGVINNTAATGRSTVKITSDKIVSDIFQNLECIIDKHEVGQPYQSELVGKIGKLKGAFDAKDKPSFLKHYQDFVGLVSSHLELFGALAPAAIPALHALAEAIS